MHSRPLAGKSALCSLLLQEADIREKVSGGCIFLSMDKEGLSKMEFPRRFHRFLLAYVDGANGCEYLSPLCSEGDFDDVCNFFWPVLRRQDCLYVLDNVWPYRRYRCMNAGRAAVAQSRLPYT